MAEKSKILVIGSTGYIGKFIVEASAKLGNPTFALVRETAVSDPAKAQIIEGFKNLGVTLLYGDLFDHESLVKAIKQVDVVISTVGMQQIADQVKLIAAIKEAGNVKRFFPSEFGNDVDCVHAVDPAKSAFADKAKIRRAIEAEGIPHTFVSSNLFAGYFLPTLAQPGATAPPRDKVVILGDGNPKVIYVKEDDIGTFTILAADEPRALNKNLYIKPAGNIYSFNDLVSLWEKKIGKTLERIYVPEEQLLKNIEVFDLVIIMMNDGRFPGGPTTEEIIEARQKHRAEDIWNGQDNVERRIFYHGNLKLEWDLSDRQKELVAMAEFGYYNSIIWVHHDVKLIYAIAERFWPKTCTFHFHFGELGITLEDVLYCVGLPITGGAVTGVQRKNYTFFMQSLLGRDPPDSAAVRGTVKYSWLKDQFSHLPMNSTEERI